MLTLWNGFDRSFGRMLAQHNRLFHEAERASTFRAGWPRVEIAETADALEVKAEVPGFSPEEISISLHEGILSLEGKTGSEKKDEQERKVLFSERRSLSFTRTFRVGRDLDGDNISAAMKDGLLTVTLPKAEASKPKQIAINSA